MRTTNIEKKIKEFKQLRNENYKHYIDALDKKINNLNNLRIKSIIKNKEYLTNLDSVENLNSIIAINYEGNEVYIPTDEIVEVKNGKLYCSSFNGGIVRWCETNKSYMHDCFGSEEDLKILGFIYR